MHLAGVFDMPALGANPLALTFPGSEQDGLGITHFTTAVAAFITMVNHGNFR